MVVVVVVVGSRHAAGPCEVVVDTCSGRPAVEQTFAVVRLVVLGGEVEAVDTLAFEVGAAAGVPRVQCYPRSLAAYAADEIFFSKQCCFSTDRPRYAVRCTYLQNGLIHNLV